MKRNKKKIIRSVTVSNSIDFFEEIIVKMNEDGYECVVVTSPGDLLDEFKQRHEDIKSIAIPMERHISLKNDIVSLFRMIKVFAREKPYIVHSMTPKAGLVSMIAGKLTGVPIRIHTFTGLVWPTSTGLKRKILMATDKILCACATHIIPEGEGVKADLQVHITKKPMKVLGYGNIMGVDMERFNPKRFDMKKDEDVFTFTFVGRIVGDKGINELVEAFTKLNDLYPHTRLKLVGPLESHLDPISELAYNSIKANNHILLTGNLHGDKLIEEYVKSDCIVMPSYREGFPNTVLEAGAMGLPSIVTDINGSREIVCGIAGTQNYRTTEIGSGKIKICKNGIIVPSKDADCLYQAMEIMLDSWNESRHVRTVELQIKNMYLSMKENARPMIESRFEKSFVQGCLINFYKEILE